MLDIIIYAFFENCFLDEEGSSFSMNLKNNQRWGVNESRRPFRYMILACVA